MLSCRHALATLWNEIRALDEIEGQFARRHKAVGHQQVASAVGPGQFNADSSIENAGIIIDRFRHDAFGLVGYTARKHAVSVGIRNDLVRSPGLNRLDKSFCQLNANVVAKGIISHDGHVNGLNIRVVQAGTAELVRSAAANATDEAQAN